MRLPLLIAASCHALAAVPTAVIPLAAQQAAGDSTSLTVSVRHEARPLVDALVRSGAIARTTDDDGVAVLRLPSGERTVIATRIGFRPETLAVVLRAGVDTAVTVTLLEQAVELTGVVVSATRSGR